MYIDTIYVYLLNNLTNLEINLLIIFIVSLFINFNKNKKLIIILILVIILYLQNNYFNLKLSIIDYNLNLNLLNGLFLIHPILIYIFYSKNYNIINKLINYNNKINFNYINCQKMLDLILHLKKKLKNNLFIIIIAISLGAWWAFQELSWGTWWNWDLVEIINLYYLLLYLFYNHTNNITLIKTINNNFFKNIFKIIILLIAVRYNLIQSIHNFISINNFYQYILYIYIVLLFFKPIKLKIKKKINFFNKLFNNFNFIYYIILINIIIGSNINILNNLNNSIINVFKLYLIYMFLMLITWNLKHWKSNFWFSLLNNEFTIISNVYKIYWSIRIYKTTHLIILMFISYIFLSKLSINLVQQVNNNYIVLSNTIQQSTNNILFFNKQLIFENNYNILNASNILNIDFFYKNNNINEYNNQLSNSKFLTSYWLEFFNNNKYYYLYNFLSNLILYLYFIIFINIKIINIRIRKIY